MEREEAVAGPSDGVTDAFELLLQHDELADFDVAERRLAMRTILLEGAHTPDAIEQVAAIVDGYGVLDRFMRDPSVTDVLVNRHDDIWVERDGILSRTDAVFASAEDLEATIERLMTRGGGRVDLSHPIADVVLPDGARMHAVIPPLSPTGPKISIRRFPRRPLSLEDLEARGMFDGTFRSELADAVRARRTIAISGGTGSGKTTLLNALLGEVPPTERVVTLEETPELRPKCAHWVSLVARPANIEGTGAVALPELFKATLRMRPDRIVVGEVRGVEALVALDAFSTGHPGSLVTVHARSALDVKDRFVALAAANGLSEATLRSRFEDAFDLVVHLERADGRRRVGRVLTTG